MNAIEIKNLKKTYENGLEALKGITLTVKEGDFFGLLGPNGAGKSTTIGILSTLVRKSEGQITIFDHNLEHEAEVAKQFLGIVPQEFNFNIFEPCFHIVVHQAGYYGVPYREAAKRTTQLFEQLGLTDKTHTPAGKLSGGLKRRLMIARGLVHNPKILILDEPTAGVDISLRRSMWRFLEERNKQGLTIILTTHYLEEAEQLCKNIAIIDQGHIVALDSTQKLLQKLKSETLIFSCEPIVHLPHLLHVPLKQLDESTLELELGDDITLGDVISQLQAQGIVVKRVKNKSNRLEELFIKMVDNQDA